MKMLERRADRRLRPTCARARRFSFERDLVYFCLNSVLFPILIRTERLQ
jgi:hypothetical protein